MKGPARSSASSQANGATGRTPPVAKGILRPPGLFKPRDEHASRPRNSCAGGNGPTRSPDPIDRGRSELCCGRSSRRIADRLRCTGLGRYHSGKRLS